MILSAIFHKFGALTAAFANVIVAAKVLDEASSLAYLSGLSLVQILVVFGGFGATQKLVRADSRQYGPRSAVPMNILTIGIGAIVLLVLAVSNQSALSINIAFLNTATLLSLSMAEMTRCALGRQDGYIASIVSTLVIAGLIYIYGTIKPWFVIVPLLSSLSIIRYFLLKEFQGPLYIVPSIADIAKAARVAFVNQSYNIIVVLIGLISVSPAAALTVVLVYRFNIFFNWQSFYWMRFGHKETERQLPEEHIRRNRKFTFLNGLAFLGLVIVTALVVVFDIDMLVNEAVFNRDFLKLVLFYAAIRVLFNLTFPYEVYSVYFGTFVDDLKFLFAALCGIAVICVILSIVENEYYIIACVEMIWVLWRIYGRKLSKRMS